MSILLVVVPGKARWDQKRKSFRFSACTSVLRNWLGLAKHAEIRESSQAEGGNLFTRPPGCGIFNPLAGNESRTVVIAMTKTAPEIVADLIHQAERAGASDIHLQRHGKRAQVAFRLDGMMTPAESLDEGVAELVFGRIKYLAKLKTYQESLPQDGRIESAAVNGQQDIRVATYPTVTGEKIVLRLFQTGDQRTLRELRLPGEVCLELERFLRGHAGLLLLTGPAGSGKTTTIYACLRHLAAASGQHIITIEDPVEQVIPGIMQTEVNEAIGLDFPKAARHLLRQDPQVLVIGEIRDDETASLAVRAALTGHLVISTLHAGSCQGVYERLLVLCPDHYAVVSSVALVLNQRLLRACCNDCGGSGCAACLQTGYHGRVPAVEWFRVDDASRAAIRAQGPAAVQPQCRLEQSARQWVESRVTTEAEYRRLFGP
ncbi:MAG: ATPase, T2SS/T4P/T4SS family [Verrucomicrobiota bacterium]